MKLVTLKTIDPDEVVEVEEIRMYHFIVTSCNELEPMKGPLKDEGYCGAFSYADAVARINSLYIDYEDNSDQIIDLQIDEVDNWGVGCIFIKEDEVC